MNWIDLELACSLADGAANGVMIEATIPLAHVLLYEIWVGIVLH